MVFAIAVAVALGIGLTFLVGRVASVLDAPATGVSKIETDPAADCASLCLLFNIRRSERCFAQEGQRQAEARLAGLMAQRDSAAINWAIATAAALTAMFIPIVGPLISSALAAVAGVFLTAVVGFEGAIYSAKEDLARKANSAQWSEYRVGEARELLLTKCPAEASSCLASPFPC